MQVCVHLLLVPVKEINDSIANQLQLLGRQIQNVEGTENSLFKSIAMQLSHPALVPQYLRQLVCCTALQNLHRYQLLMPTMTAEQLRTIFKKLKRDTFWMPKMRDVVLSILSEALSVPIAVIINGNSPLYFPAGSRPIDDCSVVMVENDNGLHYMSTKPISEAGKNFIPQQ